MLGRVYHEIWFGETKASKTRKILTSTVTLFRFRFPPNHPYYKMRDALFDLDDPRVLEAFKEIVRRSGVGSYWNVGGYENQLLSNIDSLHHLTRGMQLHTLPEFLNIK